MQPTTMMHLFSAAAVCLFAHLTVGAQPQDHPPLVGPEGEQTTVIRPLQQDDAQREMIELFGNVERKLRAIDLLLADAGSGDTGRLAQAEESGIGDLLTRSLTTGRSTLEDIDRLLELAAQMGSQQQSQSECSACKNGSCNKPGHGKGKPADGSSSQEHGGSPLDRGEQSSAREQTPEQPSGGEPQDAPRPGGEHPDSPLASNDPDPQNEEGGEPPALATEIGARPPLASERWGDLPVHVQDIFRTEGDRHMPARYRDWIDAYYRRLSARGDRR